MRIAILLIAILSSSVQAETTRAWWLDFELELTENMIGPFPASDVDESFAVVGFPSIQKVPKTVNFPIGLKEIESGTYLFEYTGIFSGAPIKHTAKVGAYMDNSGKKGRFLVIYKLSNEGAKITYFAKVAGKAGFSFMYLDKNVLHWSGCLHCGDVNPIIWKNGKFERDTSRDWEP